MATPDKPIPTEANPPQELIKRLQEKYRNYDAAWLKEYATYLCFRQDTASPFDWRCANVFNLMHKHKDVVTLKMVAQQAVNQGILPEHAFKALGKEKGIDIDVTV